MHHRGRQSRTFCRLILCLSFGYHLSLSVSNGPFFVTLAWMEVPDIACFWLIRDLFLFWFRLSGRRYSQLGKEGFLIESVLKRSNQMRWCLQLLRGGANFAKREWNGGKAVDFIRYFRVVPLVGSECNTAFLWYDNTKYALGLLIPLLVKQARKRMRCNGFRLKKEEPVQLAGSSPRPMRWGGKRRFKRRQWLLPNEIKSARADWPLSHLVMVMTILSLVLQAYPVLES